MKEEIRPGTKGTIFKVKINTNYKDNTSPKKIVYQEKRAFHDAMPWGRIDYNVIISKWRFLWLKYTTKNKITVNVTCTHIFKTIELKSKK